MKIESKYDDGQTVYHPWVDPSTKQVPCPDCLGTKEWEGHLPSGELLTFDCPTCTFGYEVRGTIGEFSCTGEIDALTIGRATYEACYGSRGEGMEFRYMAEETGIGSGRIYYESNLYATREEAETQLPAMVEKKRIELIDQNAQNRVRKIKDGPGRMVAYYRANIREAQRTIANCEERLAARTVGGAS